MRVPIARATAVLIASSLALTACSSLPAGLPGAPSAQTNAPTGERYSVAKGNIENTIVATGKVIPRQSTSLAFLRSGQVFSSTVQVGDSVKAGQILAKLDTTDLELTERQQYAGYLSALAAYSQTVKGPSASDLASAKAALQSAQAQYSDLVKPPSDNDVIAQKTALENARISLEQAQSNYDRAFRRNPAGINGSGEAVALEQATNTFNQAKANYDKAFEKAKAGSLSSAAAQIASAKAKVDSLNPTEEAILQAKAKLDQAQIAWEQAKQNTAKSVIVAPYDGVITAVNYNVGDSVANGQTMFQIIDVRRPIFQIDVDESDVGNVRVGGDARVTLQAFSGTPFTARVEKLAPQATVNGNVTTVKVDLALAGPDTNAQGAAGAAGAAAGQGQGGAARFTAIATAIAQGTPQPNLPPAAATAIAQGTPPAAALQGAFGGGQGAQGAQTGQGGAQGGQRGATGGRVFTGTQTIMTGLSGTSEIIVSAVRDVIVVPNRALSVDRATRGFTVTKLLPDGKTQSVPVQVGQRGSSLTQITEGVSEGDVILIPTATTSTTTGQGQGGPGVPGGFAVFGGR